MSKRHWHNSKVVDPPVGPLDQKAELIGRLEGDPEQPVRVERQKNIQRQKHFPVRWRIPQLRQTDQPLRGEGQPSQIPQAAQ